MVFMTSVVAEHAAEQLWLSLAINFLSDGIATLIIFALGEKLDCPLYEAAERKLGKIPVKILYFFVGVCLLTKSFVPIVEQKEFVERTLYETSPMIMTFIPFFVFSLYFCFKGLFVAGRCADIIVWLTVPAVIALVAFALPNTDYSEILPFFGQPLKIALGGSLKSSIWFFDCIYAPFFIGNYKKEKYAKTKICVSYAAAAILVIAFAVTLYAEFGVLTQRQYFPPVKMGLFSVALLNIGRVDYLAAVVVTVCHVFAISLPVLFASQCFEKIFGFKNKIIAPLITNGILTASVLATQNVFESVFTILQNYSIYALTVSVLLLAIAAALSAKGEKYEMD